MRMEAWVLYAFLGFAGYFFVNLLFKFVSSDNAFLVSLILYATAAAAMLLLLAPKGGAGFAISYSSAAIAAAIGLASVTATVFALKSVEAAPNPGYSAAIYSANFVLVAFVSVLVFGAPLTGMKFLGILATFAGLALISLG